MKMTKIAAGTGLTIAACAACCAPLLTAPVLALLAAIGAGGAGLVLAGQIGLAVLAFAGIAAVLLLQRRPAAAAVEACDCTTTNSTHLITQNSTELAKCKC